jgi:large subunit ribosomal protein L30
MSKKIAVIQIRGVIKTVGTVKDTLTMLKLYNKNYCVVVEATPQNLGMIKKVKDFVTYGEVEDSVLNDLIAKRGEEYTGPETDTKGKIEYKRKYFESNGKKYKKYFRLCPPRKGYGRKGIKTPFTKGGALGYRGTKINDLIKRMI